MSPTASRHSTRGPPIKLVLRSMRGAAVAVPSPGPLGRDALASESGEGAKLLVRQIAERPELAGCRGRMFGAHGAPLHLLNAD